MVAKDTSYETDVRKLCIGVIDFCPNSIYRVQTCEFSYIPHTILYKFTENPKFILVHFS